jgi:long-chain acyl-CoA synthetase
VGKNFNAWPDQWPKSLNYPQQPVFKFLDHTADRVPNRLAIIFGGMELTFSEFRNLADRFAAALVTLGLKQGDKVAIHLPNCPQFAIAYYGLLKVGAVFTPLSPLLAPKEIVYQLTDADARLLVSLDLIYPGIADVIAETSVKQVITTSIADCYNPVIQPLKPLAKIAVPDTLDMTDLLQNNEPHVPDIEIDVFNELAHLAYTGGTTGLSKGVMLTHYNVVANTCQYTNWFSGSQIELQEGVPISVYPPGIDPIADRITAKDRETALVVVPWFHAMGTVGYLNNPVCSGTTMVVYPRFEPQEFLDGIQKYKATALGGAPQLFIPLINLPEFKKCDLSGVKLVSSGAAPLAMSVFEEMCTAFSGVVCEGYGMTECAMGATANPPDRNATRQGSVGIPVFDTECKVVDLGTGQDLPPGEKGEICIKGPQVMQGYWDNPEETDRVLKKGWLHTGDIGYMDEDGFFYITDRQKDMIIYKGYNVYPRELEEVIFSHPDVEQCAVVGKPDLEAGESPVAFVQRMAGSDISAGQLMEYANSQIAAYKKIREVRFIDAIPVSGVGKVLKRKLRERIKS